MKLVGRKSATVVGVLLLLGVLFLVSSFLTIDYMVDYWWFDSLGYAFYFVQRLLYRYLVFPGGNRSVFFHLLFQLLDRIAVSGHRQPAPGRFEGAVKEAYRKVLQMFRTGSMRVYTPLSLILAIVIAYPLFARWEAFLLFVFGPEAAILDPVYGKDISYYLFSFPIYSLLQRRIFISFAILLIGVLFLYWLEHRLLKAQEQGIQKGAKVHLCFLVFSVFAIEIWDFFLQRYALLYTSIYEPLFSGPGYAEMRVILPFIYACILLLAITAISVGLFCSEREGNQDRCRVQRFCFLWHWERVIPRCFPNQ